MNSFERKAPLETSIDSIRPSVPLPMQPLSSTVTPTKQIPKALLDPNTASLQFSKTIQIKNTKSIKNLVKKKQSEHYAVEKTEVYGKFKKQEYADKSIS